MRDQFANKPPDNGNLLAILSKTEVNAKLTKKYKDAIKNFDANKIRERLLSQDELDAEDDENDDFCEIGEGDDSFLLNGAVTDDRLVKHPQGAELIFNKTQEAQANFNNYIVATNEEEEENVIDDVDETYQILQNHHNAGYTQTFAAS